MLLISVVIAWCVIVKAEIEEEELPYKCGMYLAPSTVPGAGRGIIAGKHFNVGEMIEITQTITFKAEIMLEFTQLNNYVYAFDANHSMVLFGAGSLYNHNKRFSTKHHWVVANENLQQPDEVLWSPYSMGNDVWFRSTETTVPGQEMYSYYGEDWFSPRGMTELDLVAYTCCVEGRPDIVSLEDWEQYGHCLTDVGLGESHIVFAGKGLFARRAFKKGEVVVIAPVISLPRRVVDESASTSLLMNYCFTLTANTTEVTLFPLNNAVALNHQPDGSANLDINWYDWTSIPSEGSYYEHLNDNALNLTEKLKMTPDELFAAPFAQFDIAFKALRDIEDGEELTFDYGYMWGLAWNNYVGALQEWERERQLEESITGEEVEVDTNSMPIFRSYIEIPEGMFPSHWLR